MKRYILTTSFLLAFFAFVFSTINAQQAEEPKGKILFKESKCVSCHAIESQGFVKKGKSTAPDLSDVGSKHSDIEWLKKYLTKQETMNDLKHAVSFKGGEEELQTLGEWLTTLKKESAANDSTQKDSTK
ncbi:MAG: c-type cytochrome [Ignavibacteriales bacterium]|nr:c-type cytochrome [Ignavibacteriales bacterium]